MLAIADDGGFTKASTDFPLAPELYFGGGCLYTTAEDYLKLQMELAAPPAHRVGILTQVDIDGALDTPFMRSARPWLGRLHLGSEAVVATAGAAASSACILGIFPADHVRSSPSTRPWRSGRFLPR